MHSVAPSHAGPAGKRAGAPPTGWFRQPGIGMAPADPHHTRAQVADFVQEMQQEEPSVLGFPGNLAFDFSGPPYAGLLSIFANNVGDPRSTDASNVSAKRFERAAIDFMVDLCRGERAGNSATSRRAARRATCGACRWPGTVFRGPVCT